MSILDYAAQHRLRNMIYELNAEERKQLKNIHMCGVGVRADSEVVYVLSNGHEAKIHGTVRCKNTFACPVCASIEMEKYRARIQSAIECLHKDYFGFMVSFAIPHFNFMSCREVMDILYDTFSYFRRKSYKRSHGHVYRDFNQVVPVKHHVRVCEQTHGKHGWHHHFHCIFWIPRGLQDEAVKWEQRLNDFWLKIARSRTLKYWQAHKLHQNILEIDGSYDKVLDRLFKEKEHHQGVVFSKDDDGNLLEADSADYISGWGADRELTGNYHKEASHEGHRTPYQILDDAAHDKKSAELYLEFCLAVTKKPVHHRVDFSQTGICKMVEEWQKVHGKESKNIQKKRTDTGTPTRWQIVAYFSKENWFDLCCLDRYVPVISNIMYLAAKHVYLLGDYLSSIGITLPSFIPSRYDEVEKLYNSLAS